MLVQYNFLVSRDEAYQIIAAYAPDGVSVQTLFGSARELAITFWQEGYFLEDGGWNSDKWDSTEFIVSSDPGPVDDRLEELPTSYQKYLPSGWWFTHLFQQLQVFPAVVTKSMSELVVPEVATPIEAPQPTTVSSSGVVLVASPTPEMVERIARSQPKKVPPCVHRPAPPGKVVTQFAQRGLVLRETELRKLNSILRTWPRVFLMKQLKRTLGPEVFDLFRAEELVTARGSKEGQLNLGEFGVTALRIEAEPVERSPSWTEPVEIQSGRDLHYRLKLLMRGENEF